MYVYLESTFTAPISFSSDLSSRYLRSLDLGYRMTLSTNDSFHPQRNQVLSLVPFSVLRSSCGHFMQLITSRPFPNRIRLRIHSCQTTSNPSTMSEGEDVSDQQSYSSESQSGRSSTESHSTVQDHKAKSADDGGFHLVRRETMAVLCSKAMVLIVITIAAAACGAATFIFTNNDEEGDFESQ